LFVTINGVLQSASAYSISVSNCVFTAAPASTDAIEFKGIQSSGTVVTLGDGVVNAAQLGSSSVVTASIVDNNVTTAKILDNNVTLAKMAGLARGKIIVGDASGDPSALTVGAANQVLKSDGTDAAWGADVGGALVHISTTTVSSVVSEIQVNDVFSATYTNYKIILTNILPDTDNNTIYMGFKENSGATQLNMNSLSRYYGVTNAGAVITGHSTEYNMGGQELFKTASNTVGINGIIEVYVPFASGTCNMTRTTYVLTGWNAAASGEVHTYGMAQAAATTSTPCFRLFSSGNIGDATITGYIRVYGYKDS
jgi:hypothetical protein